MSELKFIAACLLNCLIAIYITLFCKIEIPELDKNTEAFYHE